MSLKYGLLGLLNYGEMTGYDLSKVFEDSLNHFWRAQKSQIYRELKDMEKSGWVDARMVLQSDRPNKRIFAITAAGREALAAWLGQPLGASFQQPHEPLLLQLFFSGALPVEESRGQIAAFRDYCRGAVELLQSQPAQAIDFYSPEGNSELDPLFWRFTAEYGQRYYQMCWEWAESMLETLDSL